MQDASPTDQTVVYKVTKGPREEIQDLPFQFRLAYRDGHGYVHDDPYAERSPDERQHDLLVAGIFDGMGGAAMRVDIEKALPIAPFLAHSGLVTHHYRKAPGIWLTGRAAAHFLLDSVRRHSVRLAPDGDGYGLAELVMAANTDLYRFNRMMIEWEAAVDNPRSLIGAALTLALIDRQGRVRYVNCGDCRAAIIRIRPQGTTTEEISRKQTIAALASAGPGTTVGIPADSMILNALGLQPHIEPSFNSAELGPDDIMLHLTDGAKEALMYTPQLQHVPWDQRTLNVTCQHSVLPYLSADTRLFPAVHSLFENAVKPFVAEDSDGDRTKSVFDNAAVLALRRSSLLSSAMDHIYQGIDEGRVHIDRSALTISSDELVRVSREVGLVKPHELEELRELVRSRGLTILEPPAI